MSINALEKALWQAYVVPADAQRYRTDAQAYLKSFKLDEAERAISASWDIKAMIARGANPLLVMMAFQSVIGVQKLREYFAEVNSGAGDASSA